FRYLNCCPSSQSWQPLLTVISYQLSVISYQLSVISYQLSVIRRQEIIFIYSSHHPTSPLS
ncbi:MAG: hypothetical protein ACK58Y_09475, partial [Microcystis sp.]